MKNSFIALALIISQQTAMAATLNCTVDGDDGKTSLTITENAPQVGLATLTWSSGDSSVATSLEKTSDDWGCFKFIEKTYFHPYYTVNITAKVGLSNTRCAGIVDGYKGSISAEMQSPKGITCSIEHF